MQQEALEKRVSTAAVVGAKQNTLFFCSNKRPPSTATEAQLKEIVTYNFFQAISSVLLPLTEVSNNHSPFPAVVTALQVTNYHQSK